MTNFEKYKDEILKIIANSDCEIVAVKNGAPVPCDDIECDDCDIRDKSGNGACVSDLIRWLYEDDGADCSPDVSKPKGGCEGCHYEGNNILNLPCCHCERAIIDCFEPKKKQERKTKTRQDEFLEHYPNANVLGIQPCIIDKENSGEYCSKYDWCPECVNDYWSQEVE
jgi:hypothetical protein